MNMLQVFAVAGLVSGNVLHQAHLTADDYALHNDILRPVSGNVLHQEHLTADDYTLPQDIFGPVTAADKANIQRNRSLHRRAHSDAYRAVRTPDHCVFPINILFLQDFTGSLQHQFAESASVTLPALAATIPNEHPGSTFSLALFQDKFVNRLGEESDTCWWRRVTASSDPLDLVRFYERTIAHGGWDWPENQFGAIVRSILSPTTFPWMQGDIATRFLVLITDSAPHFEGDSSQSKYPQLAPFDINFNEHIGSENCGLRYYPSAEFVRDSIHGNDVYLGQIIINPTGMNGKALAAAEWFNSFLGQDDSFVLGNYENTANWLSEITALIDTLRQNECGLLDTTVSPIETTETESTISHLDTDAPLASTNV